MDKKNLFKGKKLSLSLKFISLVILLTTVLLLCLSYITISSTSKMGQSSYDISSDALKYQAEEYLKEVTLSSAKENNQILSGISNDAETLAGYASDIFESPEVFVPGNYWSVKDHMFPGPEGQYLNSEDELASAFSPNVSEMNDRLIDDLETEAYMDFIVPHIQRSTPNVVAIYLGTERDAVRYYPNVHLGALVPPDFQVTRRPWYLNANVENNPGRKVVWSPVYVDAVGHGLMVTAAAPVYINNDEFLGVVGMDVTLGDITSDIESATLPGGGYFFLLDNNNHVIILPDQGYHDILGRPSEEGEFATNLTNEARPEFTPILYNITNEKSGFMMVKTNETELFVTFYKMNSTGWVLGSIVKEDNMLQSITKLQNEMHKSINALIFGGYLPLGLIILLAIITVGSLLISHMIKPIQKLSKAAQQITDGRWDIEIDVPKSKDEIGQLSNSFATMYSKLKKSQKDLEKLVSERTKELQQKVDELERYKKVTVGRELRMAELKKQMEELKAKSVGGGLN